MTSTTDIRAALADGTRTIGAIAFWTLGDVSLPRAEVRAAMERLGLTEAVPRDPTHPALLTRACDDVRRGRRGDVVFDRVLSTPSGTTVARSERVVDIADEKARYQHVTRIRVAHADGSLSLEDPNDEVMQLVAARFAELRERMTTSEFGGMISHAFNGRTHANLLAGINLRGRTGGVYFVPSANVDRTLAFADYVSGTGTCSMTVWPVATGERVLAQAGAAAAADIGAKVREVLSDFRDFASRLDGEMLRAVELDSRAVRIRMDRFDVLAAKAGLYADVLGSVRDDLLAEIADAREALTRSVLTGDVSIFDDLPPADAEMSEAS